MKHVIFTASTILAAMFVMASCSKEAQVMPEQSDDVTITTRATGGIPIVTYVETNDIDPRNAMSYTMDGKPFIDIVILFAANIRGDMPEKGYLHYNTELTALLADPSDVVGTIQANGQKVLLSLLGDHTGMGFCNMTQAQRTAFINALVGAIDTYGFDGFDFDDEYAKYGTNGFPNYNTTSYAALINELRAALDAKGYTDKLITVFDWSGYGSYTNTISAANNNIDYAWYGAFGASSYGSPGISGFPTSKYSSQALRLDTNYNATTVRTYSARSVSQNRGAIMTFNLRDNSNTTQFNNGLNTLNAIAKGAYGSTKTVVHNGTFY